MPNDTYPKLTAEGINFVRYAASNWHENWNATTLDDGGLAAWIERSNFAEYCARLAVEADTFDIGNFPSLYRVWTEIGRP